MFIKSISFIRRLNRGNFYLSSQKFPLWWIISGISHDKIQNFSSISPKLCLLGQKYTGTWGVNTTKKTGTEIVNSIKKLNIRHTNSFHPAPLAAGDSLST